MPRSRLFKRDGPRRKSKPNMGDRHRDQRLVQQINANEPELGNQFIHLSDPGMQPDYHPALGYATIEQLKGKINVPKRLTQQDRPGRNGRPHLQYSKEVVLHADFLLQSQGRGQMEEYLRGLKTMNVQDGTVTANGGIEHLIQETKE